MIYLDNAGTTQMLRECAEEYSKYACGEFYNPSAIYSKSASIKREMENAKKVIAEKLGTAFTDNIIFTGSATEANNLAIMGCYRKNFGKMIFSIAEHPAVYNTAMALKNRGANVEFVKLMPSGEIDYEDLKNKLTEDTSFISIMNVNNETGAINDLKKIADLKNAICPKAIFHSDGVQAFTKIKVNVEYFGVDLYTISGHKIYGPKGVGALYCKNLNLLTPIIYGGGQEYALRSGTENVGGIMALKKAVQMCGNIKENYEYVESLKTAFLSKLPIGQGIRLNSHFSPYILSLSFDGVNGETLVHMMENEDILISRGSACSSKKAGNRILENMGLTKEQILGSVRISFSKYNTIQEVQTAGEKLLTCYENLKQMLK